ncbi:MAG: flagellar biosynthesis anti-sigma factor FlgM [Caldimonas sp.]
MKIGHPADKPPAPTPGTTPAVEVAKPAHASTAAASAAPAAADPSATVALSSTASTLLSGGGSGEFDARKVEHMTASIAGGTFKVNAETIADKLIANAQELLTQVKG